MSKPSNKATLPLSIINLEQKGETTFHVTIIDKQGKVVPNVKIQTTLAGKQLNFKTGGDGKTDITLDMNGLKHATMYATSQTGNNFIFILSQGETTRTINMDEHQYLSLIHIFQPVCTNGFKECRTEWRIGQSLGNRQRYLLRYSP